MRRAISDWWSGVLEGLKDPVVWIMSFFSGILIVAILVLGT